MSLWEFILLGIVQGISEFLPISSDGHLVLVEALLGHTTENLELNVALHFGTLISILFVYRHQIIPVLKQPRLVMAIILATLPVVVVGLSCKDLFEQASEQPLIAGFGLLFTSLLLFITPRIDMGQRELKDIRYRDALVIGLMQTLAPLPGVSRSGSTIVGALFMGVKREAAANFSFYIAVPALLGATIVKLKDVIDQGGTSTPLGPTLIGAAVAMIVGIIALKSLLRIVAARKLYWFAWYVLGVAVLTFIGCYYDVI
ncbi:undecaprenyl-diphosphate phosphatase [Planctomicrobium sp. SH661]|uniref:undecaprenyl-diphosphate phosphatase n=1 Tax=Planctomicrobium sp. SH661 TaxID=3448124 RepID=UPI003F5C3BE9